jgi:nucleoside-diphosphate-sugar epimerase
METTVKKTALIAGTTGVVGRALLEHLEAARFRSRAS